jgi:GNAT superfamily N-acetyltransferase
MTFSSVALGYPTRRGERPDGQSADGRHLRNLKAVGAEGWVVTQDVLIRPAVASDVPDLCRLAELLALQHAAYDPARYRLPRSVADAYAGLLSEQLGREDAVVLVAEVAGALVGYAFARVEPPSLVALTGPVGWIHDLYVVAEKRGRGTGSRLLDAAIQALGDLGVVDVLLGVAAQNGGAAALFRRRGFRPTLQEMALHLGHGRDEPGASPDRSRNG